MEENGEELSAKRICRFCMTQDEPLTNIYAKDSRLENAVPLPLQIMACVSIEVFNNDGMPSTICGPCRVLMDRSYRFKQICKQSDSALRQYPTTGVWPEPIPLPEDIAETIDLIDRKRTYSESQDSLKEEVEDSAPSPKRNKTYIELKPVKSPQKVTTTNKRSPMILNSQVSSTKLATPSKVLKIKRKNTVVEDNTDQFILKEDYDEDFTEAEPNKPAVHVPTDVFPCEHCDRSFPLKQLLDIHMRHHTRERKYKCDLCAKRFFSKYDLGKHMSVHSGIRPFACVACGKTFARATLLHRHEKIHVDTPKFLCNSCDKTFLSLEELDRHESNHKKRRPFACTLCPKRFAFKQGLERHEVIHARNKPFNCQYCDEGFTTPGKLARHVTAHAGARPYPCKLCPKSFLLSHHLTRHLKSHTGGSLQTTHYKCDECEKVFLRKDDLIYHSAVHATQNLTCPLCKEQFDDIDTVTDHIKSHTEGEQFPCEFCDLIFTSQDRLSSHVEQSHNDVKQEIDDNEEEEEDEQNDSNDFEDPLQMLNSITKNNQNKKAVETPVRRSQRSGKVRDYAKMVKSSNTSSEEDEEEYENEENESEEEVIEKVKPRTKDNVKTYSPTKVKETEKNAAKPKVIPKKPEILNKRAAAAVDNKSKTKGEAEISARGQRVLTRNAPKLLNKIPDVEKSEDEEEDADDVDDEDYEPDATEKEQPKTQPKVLNKSADNKVVQPKILNKSADNSKTAQPKILNQIPSATQNKAKILEQLDSKDITISPTPVKLTKAQLANVPIPRSEIVEMKIGDKMVKVQKIIMTKSEVEAMAREGKIEMKGGAMLLKQGPKLGKAIAKTMTPTSTADKTAENILPN